jgi:hypothetical protein
MSIFGFLSLGATILGGMQQKSAANKAAGAAQRAADFNADLIERDIDLLGRQRDIINANYLVAQDRARDAFETEVQGGARSGYAYGGFDLSSGTPMDVLRENAREFEYSQKVERFNNAVTNMQINDAQEEAELNAELARMQGGAQAAGLRAQGTGSLINSLGSAAKMSYEMGII